MTSILTRKSLDLSRFWSSRHIVDAIRLYTGQSRGATFYCTKYFAPMFEGVFSFRSKLSYIGEPSGAPSARASDVSFQVSRITLAEPAGIVQNGRAWFECPARRPHRNLVEIGRLNGVLGDHACDIPDWSALKCGTR